MAFASLDIPAFPSKRFIYSFQLPRDDWNPLGSCMESTGIPTSLSRLLYKCTVAQPLKFNVFTLFIMLSASGGKRTASVSCLSVCLSHPFPNQAVRAFAFKVSN